MKALQRALESGKKDSPQGFNISIFDCLSVWLKPEHKNMAKFSTCLGRKSSSAAPPNVLHERWSISIHKLHRFSNKTLSPERMFGARKERCGEVNDKKKRIYYVLLYYIVLLRSPMRVQIDKLCFVESIVIGKAKAKSARRHNIGSPRNHCTLKVPFCIQLLKNCYLGMIFVPREVQVQAVSARIDDLNSKTQ